MQNDMYGATVKEPAGFFRVGRTNPFDPDKVTGVNYCYTVGDKWVFNKPPPTFAEFYRDGKTKLPIKFYDFEVPLETLIQVLSNTNKVIAFMFHFSKMDGCSYSYWHASECPDVEKRPKLTIIYGDDPVGAKPKNNAKINSSDFFYQSKGNTVVNMEHLPTTAAIPTISLYDLRGKLIAKKDIKHNSKSIFSLNDLVTLASDNMYICTLNYGKGVKTIKLANTK